MLRELKQLIQDMRNKQQNPGWSWPWGLWPQPFGFKTLHGRECGGPIQSFIRSRFPVANLQSRFRLALDPSSSPLRWEEFSCCKESRVRKQAQISNWIDQPIISGSCQPHGSRRLACSNLAASRVRPGPLQDYDVQVCALQTCGWSHPGEVGSEGQPRLHSTQALSGAGTYWPWVSVTAWPQGLDAKRSAGLNMRSWLSLRNKLQLWLRDPEAKNSGCSQWRL